MQLLRIAEGSANYYLGTEGVEAREEKQCCAPDDISTVETNWGMEGKTTMVDNLCCEDVSRVEIRDVAATSSVIWREEAEQAGPYSFFSYSKAQITDGGGISGNISVADRLGVRGRGSPATQVIGPWRVNQGVTDPVF